MKKNAQNLLEYTLIFAAVVVIALAFVSKFDLNAIKNYVFNRGSDPNNASKLTVEAMTDEPTQTTTSGGQIDTGNGTASTTSGTFNPVETTGTEGSIHINGNGTTGTNQTTTDQVNNNTSN